MNILDLTGKTALITGASSGLGEQFAHSLSNAGSRVILAARRTEKLKVLAGKLGNAGFVEMDVSQKSSVQQAFESLEAQGEMIDICINNAGIAEWTPVFEIENENNFEKVIQTNLMGVWYVVQSVAKHMKNHSIPGSIINIGSINGDLVPASKGSAYSVSKAAVIHLTKTLVGELAPHKIRINCISPGWVRTPMISPEADKHIPKIPYGDLAQPSDLDGLILYLSSNQASTYVQGANFTIDGGMSWGGRVW